MVKRILILNHTYLFFLIIISTIIRLKINFSTEYFPGNNGAFYLLLNKDLLENGFLHYKDFPLLFYLQSFLSWILIKLNLLNINQAIDIVSRVFDSIVPALSIIPAYLLSRKIIGSNKYSTITIASISIFYFSFFTLISDFQKNSLGILWLFWLLYFLFEVNENYNYKNFAFTFLFFLLTGLTHFGSFGVAILIIIINLFVVGYSKLKSKNILKILLTIFIITLFSFSLVYLVNPFRFYSFIQIIENIFNDPILLLLIKKVPVISPFDVFQIIIVNLIAIITIKILITNKNVIAKNYFLTISISALFLSSPFLNYEIAQRLYFISYIVIIPFASFLYVQSKSIMIKKTIISFSILLIFISMVFNLTKPVYSNMNQTLYSKVLELRKVIPQNKKVIIISRHGLEYWLMWILSVDAIREDEVTEKYWDWYNEVYLMRQKKYKPPFGPAGIYGKPFREPVVINNSKLILSNDYFDLYKILSKPNNLSIFKERL